MRIQVHLFLHGSIQSHTLMVILGEYCRETETFLMYSIKKWHELYYISTNNL